MIPLKDDIPSRRRPYVMITILILNILVFIYELTLGNRITYFFHTFGVIPARIIFDTTFFTILTLFTSMFIHGGFEHIIGNMLYLWIFADNVEDAFGHGKFIILYFLSGLMGSLLQILISPHSEIPLIGASGAISGILGAYIILYPGARVLALIPIFYFLRLTYVPAVIFLGFWFLLQFLYGLGSLGAQGGVAWFAHIGGFLTGVLFALPIKRRIRRRLYF